MPYACSKILHIFLLEPTKQNLHVNAKSLHEHECCIIFLGSGVSVSPAALPMNIEHFIQYCAGGCAISHQCFSMCVCIYIYLYIYSSGNFMLQFQILRRIAKVRVSFYPSRQENIFSHKIHYNCLFLFHMPFRRLVCTLVLSSSTISHKHALFPQQQRI